MRLHLDALVRASGAVSRLASLDERSGFRLRPAQQLGKDLASDRQRRLLQVMVPVQSSAVGHSPVEMVLAERYNAVLIAVRRHGSPVTRNLGHIPFDVGDVALLIRTWDGAASSHAPRAVGLGHPVSGDVAHVKIKIEIQRL